MRSRSAAVNAPDVATVISSAATAVATHTTAATAIAIVRRSVTITACRRAQGCDQTRVDEAGRIALVVEAAILAKSVDGGDGFLVERAVVAEEFRRDAARCLGKRGERGTPVAEAVQHPLQLDDVGAFDL